MKKEEIKKYINEYVEVETINNKEFSTTVKGALINVTNKNIRIVENGFYEVCEGFHTSALAVIKLENIKSIKLLEE